ncbi:MAG: selenocysteine-specific translation elongation factor [Fimbriimonadaceae bacterium]|nr:selenocysteine-specific translation elongation factor [Chthonomonadaceae bacterium]MCO5296105.1 selenocysteine-specific translation elongation factor [Fimbriimonadaceae bacterium]
MARLIGTAGHVDHGKTTLIRALTGIDADRLPEEKKRGMTIDIGFAYIDLPGIGRASIVDVPGHERFLTNMLVGALGIDVALLCVASDESVMPQTREHLQILELLPVERLIVAMTRSDLADEETRMIAREEIEELVAASRFQSVPILEVSAVTGQGIDALRQALAEGLSGDEAPEPGPWYLPIDRVFGVKGHGCVVTGTLAQGAVAAGDRAVLQPGGLEVRVRAIHSHDESLQKAEHGRRTALNLGGVKLEDVHRGMVVGEPGGVFETTLMDARVRWLQRPKHGARVRVSAGAEEVIAKAFHNDGEPEIVQLRLESPLAVAHRQPVIIRRYSPPELLGGGRVIVPHARQRRKSEAFAPVADTGSNEDAILEALGDRPGVSTDEVCRLLGKTPQALGKAFETLSADRRVRGFAGLWFRTEAFEAAVATFLAALADAHEKQPGTAYLPRERISEASGLRWSGKPLDRILAALAAEERIAVSGTGVRHPEFQLKLTERQRQLLDRVKGALEAEAINVPGPNDLARTLAVPPQAVDEILRLGVEAGEIVRVDEGLFYTQAQIAGVKQRTIEVAQGKPFAAAQFRDAVGTTRKYAIPLLEYLDRIRFTTRVGDQRMVNG